MIYRLAELFSGPGGLGVAASNSRLTIDGEEYCIKPVWANDIDEDTCSTYAKNIHGCNLEDTNDVVCSPIEEVDDFKNIPLFDSLAFGFPCNDFSIVGETKGFDGKFGPLYTHGVRAINAQNPLWFLAENVGGLHKANAGLAFKKILEDLENSGEHGYNLSAHLYKFELYGVPQKRHRIIIIGIRNDLDKTFGIPAPTTSDEFVSCKDAIENPPILKDAPNHIFTNQSSTVIDRLKCIPQGENAWFLDKLLKLNDKELVDTMNDRLPRLELDFPELNTKKADVLRKLLKNVKLNVKSARMSHIYKRLNENEPSYTLTGSGGGGTHVYHWKENRALTNRERARLQTFPDDFIFEGKKESVRKQIGMAVPSKGAQIIFEAVLRCMAGEKYKNIEPNLYSSKEHVLHLNCVQNDHE